MARTVDPSSVWADKTLRGALTNWAEFCDGQAHELTRGEDFDAKVSAHAKRSIFRQWAKRQGYDAKRVHTSVSADGESFVIYVEGGHDAKAGG